MRSHLKGIDVFVAAVESENFTQAAARLSITPSAVGKSISRLEERLGVLLFRRTTRRQALTDEGMLFYEYCVKALEEVRTGEALLDSGKWGMKGRLRLSMPAIFGHYCLAPILLGLARENPELELDLSFSDRTVDMIEEGFDLAVRIGTLPDSINLVARRLGEHKMTFCASPFYLKQYGTPVTIDDLTNHQALAYTRFGQVYHWQYLRDGQVQALIPKTQLRSDDFYVLLDAAISGLGIAWLPYWLIRASLISNALQELLPDLPPLSHPIHALWPRTPHLPLKIRATVDALVNQLPERLAKIEDRIA